MRRLSRPLAALAGVLLLAVPASAHSVGTRFDTPLPLPLLFGGSGATVALTALLLARMDETPMGQRRLVSLPPTVTRGGRLIGRLLFLAAFGLALVEGVAGPSAPLSNFATLFVWPLLLKGVALLAILGGSPWRVLSPWRTLYDGLTRLEGREIRLRPYPNLGEWPAFVGFLLVVGIAENLTQLPQRPELTAGLLALYATLMVAGGVVFGPQWFERADALAVFYRLLGRASPLEFSNGDLVARVPWRGCLDRLSASSVAFVVAAVYTVSFDGFVESPEYQTLYFGARDALGVGPTVSVGLYLVGLAGFLLVFIAVTRLAGRLGDISGPARAFAASVVPIAAAYELAHSLSYVLTYLGLLPRTVGVEAVDLLAWLPLSVYWGLQVVLIVVGHVVAVVAAHAVADRLVDGRRRALLAHAPLVVLMVGYTVLSLWIISRPVAS